MSGKVGRQEGYNIRDIVKLAEFSENGFIDGDIKPFLLKLSGHVGQYHTRCDSVYRHFCTPELLRDRFCKADNPGFR